MEYDALPRRRGALSHLPPSCAFAVWSTFPENDVAVDGAMQPYGHRSDESGRWIILAGTLDDITRINVDRHVGTRSKHDWVAIPASVPSFAKGWSA